MLDNDLDELLNEDTAHGNQASHKRKSLGRGLGALLGDDLEDESHTEIKPSDSVNVNDISLVQSLIKRLYSLCLIQSKRKGFCSLY